ncbi:DUF1690 domain-containing protein [Histoplasma capsulatum]|uniref:DUF1690 domain-containing protein n=1 Tax=Ajellomyces capsulatus TaxID=5037 RepID=A0A8A1M585_AJECA|nr:DUF1690 domain-containing protein [Histoplasma capsulatum]
MDTAILMGGTPIQFSQEFVESLQASSEIPLPTYPGGNNTSPPKCGKIPNIYMPKTNRRATTRQTDSSRAQTIELHIQNRIAAELERIRARETQTLADLAKHIAEQSPPDTAISQPQSNSHNTDPSLSPDAPRVPLSGPGSPAELSPQSSPKSTVTAANGVPIKELSSAQVQQEISALSAKLAERRRVRELDAGVEKAREEVVRCLRGNETRPLDCWREVEGFKREVGRLERLWVEKVVG